jgi:DNA-binding NtrC family response regulator
MSCRILVVDDDQDTCRNLSDILTDFGHTVTTAHDGPSALAVVREHAFDVALLDFKMPGMDGLTLYRVIKRLRPETVAIIITADATEDTTENALHAGAWRVLHKPVDLQLLMGLVETAENQPLILIVDDDADLCASLWDVFRDHGFRVAIALDATEAVRALDGGRQRVVLLDMKLPHGDGADVLQAVRERNPRARVVLITGHRAELEGVIQRAVTEGADAVCYKPFDMPMLVGTIQELASREPN